MVSHGGLCAEECGGGAGDLSFVLKDRSGLRARLEHMVPVHHCCVNNMGWLLLGVLGGAVLS